MSTTSKALIPASKPEALGPLAQLTQAAGDYVAASRALETRRAYRHQWSNFTAWCEAQGIEALPAQGATVALYATHMAGLGRKVSGIEQALAAITAAHKAAGYPNPRDTPQVAAVIGGIRREIGTAQDQKAPVLVGDLRAMVEQLPDTLHGARNRALLLVGFAGAFRRSELVALDFEDLAFTAEGVVVTIRRSKTDQEGAGRKVAVPFGSDVATCPVRSLKAWLELAGIVAGPVFRSVDRHGRIGQRLHGADVARTVKRVAKAAGLDPSRFSGHSLRAGLATSAAKAGKSERSIMKTTGHRSTAMVRRYIRDANLFEDCAATGLGL